ncbi:MAG: tetratricopeptide repeat protein [Kiritimatiellia bacterium]
MKKCIPSSPLILLLGALSLLPLTVRSQAYIVAPGGNRVDVERILVRPDGSLVVTIQGQPRDVAKDQYLQAVGIKPPEIDQAQELINQGKSEEAAEILKGVVQSSRFQSWDAFAGEKLAAIELKKGNALEAKRIVDSLERRYGDNMTTFFPFLEKVLWDVKIQSGDTAGLEEQLTQIIEGDSPLSRKSRALIARGDVKAGRREFEPALLDYLRANYFYGEIPEVQAEALFKSASMFAKIGDTGRLRKYSALLKEKYPDSEYASQEIGG